MLKIQHNDLNKIKNLDKLKIIEKWLKTYC